MASFHIDFCQPLRRLSFLFPFILAIPHVLDAGETCSISQGATTITAFCQAGCCSSSCCAEGETEGISTITIAMCALLVVVIIVIIIIAIVYSCRKKKPRCLYGNKSDDNDEDKMIDDSNKPTGGLMVTSIGRGKGNKKVSNGDESSSGYSSTQSIHSINNKRQIARPASPFKPKESPAMNRSAPKAVTSSPPKATADTTPFPGLTNLAFDKSGDHTDILVMKKNKSPTSKTVTFKSRPDSPKGSLDSLTNNKVKPQERPPISTLHRASSSGMLRSDMKAGIISNFPRRGSEDIRRYPLSPRRGSDDINNTTPRSLRRGSYDLRKEVLSPRRGSEDLPKTFLSPLVSSDESKKTPLSPRKEPHEGKNSVAPSPILSAGPFSNSSDNSSKIARNNNNNNNNTSMNKSDQHYTLKDYSYMPKIVQVASSNNSLDSLDLDEQDSTTRGRVKTGGTATSPKTTTAFVFTKGMANANSTSGLRSPRRAFSPQGWNYPEPSQKTDTGMADSPL